jgi:hypothetical protein
MRTTGTPTQSNDDSDEVVTDTSAFYLFIFIGIVAAALLLGNIRYRFFGGRAR